MRQPVPSLTGLRFFAAFAVLISHALPKIFPLPEGHAAPVIYALIDSLSGPAMSLFFVLSGFVIYYNYSEQLQRDGLGGHFNFFVARFARLYPLYLCCLAFDLLYSYSYAQLPPTWLAALPFYLTLTFSWLYLPLGNHALIYQFGLMPSVAWSISTEWFFYCAFPLICPLLAKAPDTGAKLRIGAIVSAIAVAIPILVWRQLGWLNEHAVAWFGPIADVSRQPDSFSFWLLYFSPYCRIFEFIVGCVCASIYMGIADAPPKPHEQQWGNWALIAAIGAIAALHVVFFNGHAHTYLGILMGFQDMFLFALPMAALIFCCARYKSSFASFLSLPLIVLSGEISYSIYLLHLPVIFAFRWEAAPVSSPRVLIGDGLRFGMMTLAIIGLSLVTYTIIEVPARRLLRRLQVAWR